MNAIESLPLVALADLMHGSNASIRSLELN